MTRRQSQLLRFIIEFQRKNGFCASYTEMCEALGVAHRSGINRILASLQKRGYVTWIPALPRSVKVLRDTGDAQAA